MTNTAATTADTTPAETPSIEARVAALRSAFNSGRTRSLEWRLRQLDALIEILTTHAGELVAALGEDMNKPPLEAHISDISFTVTEVRHLRKHLGAWMQPRKAKLRLQDKPGKAYIVAEPLGVSLVISPWNYPVQLTVSPIAAALAAGNAVALKPSELVPRTTEVLSELLRRYLDPDAFDVFEGGPEVSTALLEARFDHIFFTGSTTVGRVVAQAAAKHLTPTVLELGGKSPVIVASDADIETAATRVAWGKGMNAGQTCIAPDYVLIDRTLTDRFTTALAAAWTKFYGDDPTSSPHLASIVNDRHLTRVRGLLNDHGGTIACGGTIDDATRRVAPTAIVDPNPGSAVMSEEIFGPLLPIISVGSLDEAIEFVNERPKPLALYVFGGEAAVEHVVGATTAGGVCVNQVMMHIGSPELPFGGVGESGMGRYHGRSGFEALSNMKPVFERPLKPELSIIYPPYTKLKAKLLSR